MENKISVHNLKKNFGKLEVLKDISIEIREGEVVCMIGPSGSLLIYIQIGRGKPSRVVVLCKTIVFL